LHQEKKFRSENDANRCAEVCKQILELAWEKKNYIKTRDWLAMLVKRRGQAKQAIVDSV